MTLRPLLTLAAILGLAAAAASSHARRSQPTMTAVPVPGGSQDLQCLVSAPDCGPYRRVCGPGRDGTYWCCAKEDRCADTNGGCERADEGGRKPGF
jgi:hypothetical protein